MMKVKPLSKWCGGKLFAFSGFDGQTDFRYGLVCRTNFTNTGMKVKLPDECEIVFDEFLPLKTEFTPDYFKLTLQDKSQVKCVFVDAHHILIEGKCKVDNRSRKLAVKCSKSKTLVGAKKFFDTSKLSMDVDKLIAERKRWAKSIKIASKFSGIRLDTLSGALLQMKSQVCSPEGIYKLPYSMGVKSINVEGKLVESVALQDGCLIKLELPPTDGCVVRVKENRNTDISKKENEGSRPKQEIRDIDYLHSKPR